MQRYEYKTIPAPTRGEKARGVKTPADRFAHTLTVLMNEMAAEGWEYIRADTLPAEERAGFTRKVTVYQNILVFRRLLAAEPPAQAEQPEQATQPAQPTQSAKLHLSAAAPTAGPAPRISVRDDSNRTPTIKLGAAASRPAPDDAARPAPNETTGS